MTSSPNDYEMLPQSDNEQDAEETIDITMIPPISPSTPLSTDREQDASRFQQTASQEIPYRTTSELTSAVKTVRLALTLLIYRNLSTLLENPFLELVAGPSPKSMVRYFSLSDSLTDTLRVDQSFTSLLSPQPSSPKLCPWNSLSTSQTQPKEAMVDIDVEMVNWPILPSIQPRATQSSSSDIPLSDSGTHLSSDNSAPKSPSEMDSVSTMCAEEQNINNVEMSYGEQEDQTFDTNTQHPNDSDTESESLHVSRAENFNQTYVFNEKEESDDKQYPFVRKKQRMTQRIGSVTFDRTDDENAMKESHLVTALPSSILNHTASEKVFEMLQRKHRMRGLENNGNTCFINVILQSLMSCDPFRNLALSAKSEEGTLLEKFSHLAWEMTEQAPSKRAVNDFKSDTPLLPKWFFGVFKPSGQNSVNHSGTQEDAEEFLSFLLNKLQDEEVALREGSASGENSDICSSGWQKGIQGQKFVDTNISNIFGGSSLSEVRRTSQNPSLTEASFFSLSLDVDIDSVESIPEALKNYHATEIISEEFDSDGKEMRIEKQLFMTETPQILVLHLKRFAYDRITFAPKKVMKEIQFSEVLEIPDSIMRATDNGREMRRTYQLMAVVTHLGLRLAGGHYFCDVRFKRTDGSSTWVRCDDAILKEVTVDEVLRRSAYVLFYCAI